MSQSIPLLGNGGIVLAGRLWLVIAATIILAAWTHGTPTAPTTSVVVNFDGNGTALVNQVTTYDINGDVIDAFQGSIQQFNGTFYWYGMGMGCGFTFNYAATPWCGFNVYSSDDLINWTPRGALFDPSTWQTKCAVGFGVNGCWEIHGAFNAATGLYVFWFLTENNVSPANDGYLVVTCTTPYGGCTQATSPTLTYPDAKDVNLFVDPNTSVAYLVHGYHGQVAVEQLDASYTNTTGAAVLIPISINDGYTMYYNNGTYYVSASPGLFPTGARTFYMSSSTPLGTYTLGGTDVNGTSCGGQQTAAQFWPAASSVLIYHSELWNNALNEGLANHYFGPYVFTGAVPSVTCQTTSSIAGVTTYGKVTAYAAGADQTDESATFRSICDITGTTHRMQTFVPSRNGSISKVQMPLARNVFPSVCKAGSSGTSCDGPDGSVTVSVVTLDGSSNPVSTLWSQSITGSTLSWTPKEVALTVTGASVTGGTPYGLKISASNTKACYSVGYSNNLQYAAGIERVSSDGGSTWTTDSGASLKFSVFLQ